MSTITPKIITPSDKINVELHKWIIKGETTWEEVAHMIYVEIYVGHLSMRTDIAAIKRVTLDVYGH